MVRLVQVIGHKATAATSGREALDALEREHRPDLVLLDVMMPEMDGLEVLRTVRADGRFDDLAVVMYTAVTDPVKREEALRLGAQDYAVKGRVLVSDLQLLIGRYVPNEGRA